LDLRIRWLIRGRALWIAGGLRGLGGFAIAWPVPAAWRHLRAGFLQLFALGLLAQFHHRAGGFQQINAGRIPLPGAAGVEALLAVAFECVPHLKPGGRFWLDIFQPNLSLLARPRSQNLDPVIFYIPELNRTVFRNTTVKRDPAAQIQEVTFRYRWFDDRGGEHNHRVTFPLTFIFPRELRILLERNGLMLQKMYGDYDGSDLNSDSPRIIALCRRRWR
jgi:hypothetical protein